MNQNTFTKAAILTLAVAVLTTASPVYAASAGRIGGGTFRSYSGGSSSRSYSGGDGGRSYSSGVSRSYSAPRTYAPSIPRAYTSQPSRSSTNIVVIPEMPVFSNPVPRTSVPSQVVSDPVADAAAAKFALGLILFLGVGTLALFLLFGGWSDYVQPMVNAQREKFKKLTLVRMQVALLASAKDVQKDLIRMAERGDTSSSYGLSKILRETSLTLLRNPDRLVYSSSDLHKVPQDKAEDFFNQLSMEERSKTSEEVLSNVSGKVVRGKDPKSKSDGPNEYILVSMIVATNRNIDLKVSDSVENLRQNLLALGTVTPADLVALEIIWQPEDEGEVLTQEELLALYPNLNHL